VRSAEDAIKMAQAGANRLGTSASIAIVTNKADGKAKGY
jgi:deoxyribose-phosphate aldolase